MRTNPESELSLLPISDQVRMLISYLKNTFKGLIYPLESAQAMSALSQILNLTEKLFLQHNTDLKYNAKQQLKLLLKQVRTSYRDQQAASIFFGEQNTPLKIRERLEYVLDCLQQFLTALELSAPKNTQLCH